MYKGILSLFVLTLVLLVGCQKNVDRINAKQGNFDTIIYEISNQHSDKNYFYFDLRLTNNDSIDHDLYLLEASTVSGVQRIDHINTVASTVSCWPARLKAKQTEIHKYRIYDSENISIKFNLWKVVAVDENIPECR